MCLYLFERIYSCIFASFQIDVKVRDYGANVCVALFNAWFTWAARVGVCDLREDCIIVYQVAFSDNVKSTDGLVVTVLRARI